MILIIGGAYQGKLDYAKERFHLSDEEIITCTDASIAFSGKCVDHIEEFTYACVREGINPTGYFRERKELWKDSVLICQDLFCGVVPLGADLRLWRQITGRLCQYLAGEAEQVVRIFCGLEQRLK